MTGPAGDRVALHRLGRGKVHPAHGEPRLRRGRRDDVPLLRATCDRLVALDAGRIIATGTPAEVLGDPAVVRAYLGTAVVGG